MGGWVGGQAEYVLVPYADWNLLKFPDRDQALEKVMDLTMLSDIFPTGFHGAVTAGVGVVSQGDPKDQIEQILGVPEVDCGVDAVGFEARGHGKDASHEAPATVLNSLMEITAAGGALGIPGLYVTGDPGGIDEAAQHGSLSLSLGTGWAKSLSFTTGQCPVMKYNRGLMMAILHEKVQIAKAVNAKAIPLEDAPKGYAEFDAGAATKYVLNPNGYVKN
jgi:glutathione-independent formaldehyde dehydrogenase